MADRVIISSDGDDTSIQIGNGLNSRIKLLFAIEAVGGVFCVLIFSYLFTVDGFIGVIPFLLSAAIIVFGVYVTLRYTNKITEHETITVSNDFLTITKKSLFQEKIGKYDFQKVSDMKFAGFEKYTDHPLKGESFDYLGFQTADKQIQTIHEEGTVSFMYEGETVYFGKRLPSWEVEKIAEVIISKKGNSFEFDGLYEIDTEEV